jgi:hypothetical protein
MAFNRVFLRLSSPLLLPRTSLNFCPNIVRFRQPSPSFWNSPIRFNSGNIEIEERKKLEAHFRKTERMYDKEKRNLEEMQKKINQIEEKLGASKTIIDPKLPLNPTEEVTFTKSDFFRQFLKHTRNGSLHLWLIVVLSGIAYVLVSYESVTEEREEAELNRKLMLGSFKSQITLLSTYPIIFEKLLKEELPQIASEAIQPEMSADILIEKYSKKMNDKALRRITEYMKSTLDSLEDSKYSIEIQKSIKLEGDDEEKDQENTQVVRI